MSESYLNCPAMLIVFSLGLLPKFFMNSFKKGNVKFVLFFFKRKAVFKYSNLGQLQISNHPMYGTKRLHDTRVTGQKSRCLS